MTQGVTASLRMQTREGQRFRCFGRSLTARGILSSVFHDAKTREAQGSDTAIALGLCRVCNRTSCVASEGWIGSELILVGTE